VAGGNWQNAGCLEGIRCFFAQLFPIQPGNIQFGQPFAEHQLLTLSALI
jgi:hypothetical protein